VLVYADDVNILGDNIDNIKKNTQTLTDPSKEIGLEVNTENTTILVYCCLVTKMQGKIVT
jgi:nitrous oxide reductase